MTDAVSAVETVARDAAQQAASQTAAATVAVVEGVRAEADATVSAAGAAVALANTTAAAAELEAATLLRQSLEEISAWRTQVMENQTAILARLEATEQGMLTMASAISSVEAGLLALTPPKPLTEGEPEVVVVEPGTQVVVEAVGDGSQAVPTRKRRWI